MIKDSKWREGFLCERAWTAHDECYCGESGPCWLHDARAQAPWLFAEFYWAHTAKCYMDRESEPREAHVVVFEMLDGMTFDEALCILGNADTLPSENEVTHTIKSGSEWTDIVIHAAKVHVLNVLEHELDDWIKDTSPQIFACCVEAPWEAAE